MSFRNRQEQAYQKYYSSEQIKRVILSCGLDVEFEVDSDYIVFCPYHSNFRTPAGEISKSTGQFYCFSCQESKNFTEFVMDSTKRSYFEAVRLIDSKKTETDISNEIYGLLNKNNEFVEFDIETVRRLNKDALASSRAVEYLKGRSITKNSVEKYLIGYSEKQDMVTIPIFSPDGLCVGMVGRSIEGKSFLNTPGLPKSKTMFNIQRTKAASQVFLVESSFDAIRIEQLGRAAVATLGSTVSGKQIQLLKKYFTSIILLPDNDEAGVSMQRKLQESLGNIIVSGAIPNEYKDVSDLDENQLSQLIYKFDNMIEYILN